ncbi:MAG: hypothetical protein OXH94_05915 [Rhodospirillales bacterium]|nr:hypothetical protein [Rhodospirillales bacterium]
MSDPVTRAVEVPNDALCRDPEVIARLVNRRVDLQGVAGRH